MRKFIQDGLMKVLNGTSKWAKVSSISVISNNAISMIYRISKKMIRQQNIYVMMLKQRWKMLNLQLMEKLRWKDIIIELFALMCNPSFWYSDLN